MSKLIIGILSTVIGGLILLWLTQGLFQSHSTKTLTIMNPNDANTVDMNNSLHGTTPYPDRYHYIIVTTPIGDDIVQHGPLKIAADGSWAETVRFGSAIDGGKKFLVRILATKATIPLGPLSTIKLPEDAVFSKPVSVERKRE